MAVPLLTPPLRGVGLGSAVGAGLIREGVGPCVGWCEGDSVGYVGGVEQVHRQVPLPAAPQPCRDHFWLVITPYYKPKVVSDS